MKHNLGSTDRIIRMMLGVAIGYFSITTEFETTWLQVVLLFVSAIFLITTFVGYCPMYSLFKVNSCDLK